MFGPALQRDWPASGRNPLLFSFHLGLSPCHSPSSRHFRLSFPQLPPLTTENMFRPAARALVRRAPAVAGRGPAGSRLISTGPAPKSRTWKSTVVRLGLAAGAVYYYNTSSVFANEPTCMLTCVFFSLFPGLRSGRGECDQSGMSPIGKSIGSPRHDTKC